MYLIYHPFLLFWWDWIFDSGQELSEGSSGFEGEFYVKLFTGSFNTFTQAFDIWEAEDGGVFLCVLLGCFINHSWLLIALLLNALSD